mgnify:CR=1 FL=1
MSLLIKNVSLNDQTCDIHMANGLIQSIGSQLQVTADRTLDGQGLAALPSFINTHTHSAMTLFRGYADDIALFDWLEKKIWPIEAGLTEEAVYWGARLACLEMIKSGATYMNDMYWHHHGTMKALRDSGIRGTVSAVFLDHMNADNAKEQRAANEASFLEMKDFHPRVTFGMGPHAIYTVSPESLMWVKEFAAEHQLKIQIHCSEAEREVNDCLKAHGKRPVHYLNDMGFLGPEVMMVHMIWLDDSEIAVLQEHDISIAHCPSSNMKISSGILPYPKLKEAGLNLTIATDGAASNNNLDMLEEMKTAALLQKVATMNPEMLPAEEAFQMGTLNGAKALDLNCGEIKEGAWADMILVDLNHVRLVPNHCLIPNLVYSSHASAIHTTICDGQVLMHDGKVDDEEEVKAEATRMAQMLIDKL